MAKGYQANQERLQALSLLGKDLARRAKSKCELSGESGVSLKIYEVPPAPAEPDFEKCILISENTLAQIENPKMLDSNQWRILAEQIWSDIPAVQILAIRMLAHIAKTEHWAQEILDDAYLEDSILVEANKQAL